MDLPSSNLAVQKWKNSQQKIKNTFNNKILPFMNKVSKQRHLSAIRDAFGTMIPIIIAGSIGLLIAAIIFGGSGSGKVSLLGLICKAATNWSWETVQNFGVNGSTATTPWSMASQIGAMMFSSMQAVTIGMMSLYFAFLFGYFIAVMKNYKQPIMVGFASLAGFLIANMGQITFCMDARGLISAIVFGIISSELFLWFANMKRLEIRLPEGVPPAVGKSFAVFLPMTFTIGAIAIANVIVLAPALAATHWTVDASQYQTIANVNGSHALDDFFKKDLIVNQLPSQFQPYHDLIAKLPKYFGAHASDSPTDFSDFFNRLNEKEQSIVTTYLLYANLNISLDMISSFDSEAIIHFATTQDPTTHHELVISMILNYQGITLQSQYFGWGEAIYKFFTSWFISFATSGGGLGLALIYTFGASFFWFFGIHGMNVMSSVFAPIWYMILAINSSLYQTLGMDMALQSGQMSPFGMPFFSVYGSIGGSGDTLTLIVAVFIFSRHRDLKEVSKFALPSGIFQINEPVIFGFPLVLNGRFILPFIVAPMIDVIIAWAFIDQSVLGWVHPPVILAPWTSPWFVNALLSTLDPKALIPAFIGFAVSFSIYLPFVIWDSKASLLKLKKENPEQYIVEMRYISDPIYRLQFKNDARAEKDDDELMILAAKAKNCTQNSRPEAKLSKRIAVKKKNIVLREKRCAQRILKLQNKMQKKQIIK